MAKLEAVLLHVLSLLKSDMSDYCDLETVDGDTLVAHDGSLASILEFGGNKSVLGRDDFSALVARMERTLASYFRTRGHQLQVVFRRDLDASATLDPIAANQRATSQRLHLDVSDLIDESMRTYSRYVYEESCYLVLWSRPVLLDPIEVRMAREETTAFRKAAGWPAAANAQNLLRPIRFLYDRHQSFVSKIFDDLSAPGLGCALRRLDVSQMLRAVRRGVLPDYTHDNWRAAVPGAPMPPRWKDNARAGDVSELLYPPLPQQIMAGVGVSGSRDNPALPDATTICIGGRVYAPLLLDQWPNNPQLFNTLFAALNRAETREAGQTRAVPYSASFMLESDGLSGAGMKALAANLLAITSKENRNINLAVEALRERQRDSECIVKMRLAVMTWAGSDAEGVRELALRKSKLWKAVESWGGGQLIERAGNPMLAFGANVAGLSWKHIGNPAPAPLSEALEMLPLTRPASPFPEGSALYRSLDGKLLRYQRFSSEQTTWITLIAGKPGSGKSVLMNNNNLESCLMPGLTRLPYICIIDIGVSSSGFIDLVRDNLPEHLRHLAIYRRLQNTGRDCINPMDLALGRREPLHKDRAFLVNFLCTLATPPERRGHPYEGMSAFAGRVIDGAYRMKSDRIEKALPETYKRGHDALLDAALERLGLSPNASTSYWELVDTLFRAGLVHEAEVAQRYAVPTLNDLVAYAASAEIAAEYGAARVENGMSIHEAFRLGVREAIADYPMFAGHTCFDIGSARVLALDLQDVALMGSDAAFKQTALMYMMARQSFLKKVAFSAEDLQYFDPLYRPFYERLVGEITEDYKVLCMDEFHKTGGHSMLNQQVLTDGREARKWNLEIVLASQLMEDFGELTKIATSIFLLDSGTEQTRRWLRENVGLSAVEEGALVNYVHGATAHGATFLARFATKTDTYSQLFTMTVGPMRLWALSTTAEDRKLRGLLYAALPGNEARALLARYFPAGSCKRTVDNLKAEVAQGGGFVDEAVEASVIERIARQMLDERGVAAAA